MAKEYVYIINNLDIPRIKIGVSNDIDRRIYNLQNAGGCSMELLWCSKLLINAYFIESLLHYEFRESRHIGEWFNIDKTKAIDSAIKIIELNGKYPQDKPIYSSPEKIHETPFKRVDCHVKELCINHYKRIKPGIYMDAEGKIYSIKYRMDGSGWNVSELEKI